MELRQLRYFVAVAEELHFGRAARRLHISQSPLSQQIRTLEHELRVSLFERTTRRVELTAAGEDLKRALDALLPELDAAVQSLHAVRDGRAGRVTVGFVSSASYSVIPRAVREFARTSPGVEIALRPLTSTEQAEALFEGEIDLGLLRGGHADLGMRTEILLEESLVACLPADHRLARQAEVGPEELAAEPMISFPYRDMPAFLAEVDAIFAPGQAPRVTQRTVHQETALGLVAAGVGFVVLPESVTTVSPAGVHVRPIVGGPTSRMLLASRPGRLESFAAARDFAECLRRVAEEDSVVDAVSRRAGR